MYRPVQIMAPTVPHAVTRRRLLTATASGIVLVSGCSALRGATTQNQSQGNECPDKFERFHIENDTREAAAVDVTVLRDNSETVFDEQFTVPAGEIVSPADGVFTENQVEYSLRASHADITRRVTLAGKSCEGRKQRFVSIVVETLSNGDPELSIDVTTGDTQT